MANKKKVSGKRSVAITSLILLFFLLLGNTYAARSDWVELIDTSDECYYCHTTYKICKADSLDVIQQRFDITWRDVYGRIIDHTGVVDNFKIQIKSNITNVYSCKTDNFNYTMAPNVAECFADNGTQLNRIVDFYAWDVPSKTVWWKTEGYVSRTKEQIKDGLISADIGTCWTVQLSGLPRTNKPIDHFLTTPCDDGVCDFTEYAWWSPTLHPTDYFNSSSSSGGFNSDYCRAINFTKSGTDTITHVAFYGLYAPTNNPEGGCRVYIHDDNSYAPGTALAYAEFTDAQCEATATNYTAALNESIVLSDDTAYWYVYSAAAATAGNFYRAARGSYAGGTGMYSETYSGNICVPAWTSDEGNDYLFMVFETVAGDTASLEFNHTEVNQTIDYDTFSVNVTANYNITACNITFGNGSTESMTSTNVTYYYYNLTDEPEGNITYYVNCSYDDGDGGGKVNTTLGWTYINLPLNLTWDWDERNTTINASSTIVYVNVTYATGCIINFNHTNYTMTESGNQYTYSDTFTQSGNLSTIYVICNDSLNNTNQTNTVWLYVNFTASSNTSLIFDCPYIVTLNEPFLIWVNYSTVDGIELSGATVNITDNESENTMVWNATSKLFDNYYIYSERGYFTLNISATLANYENQNGTCNILVAEWFDVEATFWFLREYNDNGTRVYTQLMNERYLNDFGYVIYRLEDITIPEVFQYNCTPVEPPFNNIGDMLNWGWDFGGGTQSGGALVYFEPYLGCNKYYFHGRLINGEANVSLPQAGNYSMWLISGTMNWENPFSPPIIVDYLGIWQPFPATYYNGSNVAVNWGLRPSELDFWGALVDDLFIFLITIIPILIGIGIFMLTGDIKMAISIATLYSVLILLIKGGVI